MKYPEYIEKEQLVVEAPEVLEKKVRALLKAMTLEEKMNLLHGASVPEGEHVANAGWLPGVGRLGVPEIRMFDGPAGVTSVYETTGLPMQEVLAATWDKEMAYGFGKVEGSENFAISGNTQLGSQVDVVRNPQFERVRDMLGEDPFLVSELSVEEIKGIQDQKVSATLKHFGMCAISVDVQNPPDQHVDEQTMHEMYFPSFEAAIQRGGASSVMSAYNKFNGAFASANTYSQIDVLRNMWGFKGYTMCDWGGNHGLTVHKGNDVEMPTGAYNSNERFLLNLGKGRISQEDIDQAAAHVLYGIGMIGYLALVRLDDAGNVLEEEGRITPIRMKDRYAESVRGGLLKENAKIAQEIAEKGITLLKNEDKALPLTKEDFSGKKVAFLGLAAEHLVSGTSQERSYGVLSEMTSPVEAVKALAGPDANILSETGLDLLGETIPGKFLWQDEECTMPGLIRKYGVTQEDSKGTSMRDIIMAHIMEMMAKKQQDEQEAAVSVGGAGTEFKGVAASENEEDDPIPFAGAWVNALAGDMEGKKTGETCCIDKTIDFTVGTLGTGINQGYKNASDGNAFTRGNIYTWSGFLKVDQTGDYDLLLQAIGGNCALKIRMGDKFIPAGYTELRESAHWPWGNVISTPEGMEIKGSKLYLEAGKAYEIRLVGNASLKEKDLQIRLAWITPDLREKQYRAALKAAEEADKVVFFITDDYEVRKEALMPSFLANNAEPQMAVPQPQKQFFLDVCRVMKPTAQMILVDNHSQMLALGEVEPKCEAILEIASPGQEGGKALARILLGIVNPSGKTALTFPKRKEDTLVSDTKEHLEKRHMGYKEGGRTFIDFDEGIFTGYRWYEKEDVEPLYPFGHGLSYTTFEYSNLMINGTELSFIVTNTGDVAGTEIAQVYLGEAEVPEYIMMAKKQLCGFAREEDILPGESRKVTIRIPERSFCYWDPKQALTARDDGTKDKWVKTQGTRKVWVGASSSDLRLEGNITVY